MTLHDLACIAPDGFTRENAETSIPKIAVSLGEITSKAGDNAVFGPLGLSTIKYMLLHVLSKHMDCPTMTDLRKNLLRSPANLTQLVDDLEEQGWIRRVPSPTDRRAKQIELTDAGHAKVQEAEEAMQSRMKAFFAGYTDDDLKSLMTLLTRFGNDLISVLGMDGIITYPEV